MKETKDHSRVTATGREAGFLVARIVEPAVQWLACHGEPDERCKSCAGTYGTVPNGCEQTQSDFVKAMCENVPFLCHDANRLKNQIPCHAWYAARIRVQRAEMIEGKRLTRDCPWGFSPPDSKG